MTLRDFGLDMSWLINFSAGKTQLFSFDWPNITGGIDVKVDGKNHLLRCWVVFLLQVRFELSH